MLHWLSLEVVSRKHHSSLESPLFQNCRVLSDFKVQAEKTITHLEGRIRRLEK
jgi:hypothetical protein